MRVPLSLAGKIPASEVLAVRVPPMAGGAAGGRAGAKGAPGGGIAAPRMTVLLRNMIPDVPLFACPSCSHVFHREDLEAKALQKGGCPACGASLAEMGLADAEEGGEGESKEARLG